MGMTIDESKQLLSDYQRLFNSLNGNYKLSQVQISELSHSISTALDTMRKYQRVQEIIKSEMSYDSSNMNPNNLSGLARALEIFGEVEDGNDD